MASRIRSGVVLLDGASTGSAPPQDKRINLPLSTKARTASTGGSAPASHRRAFAAKAASMSVPNRKDALGDQAAKMMAVPTDWRDTGARVNTRGANGSFIYVWQNGRRDWWGRRCPKVKTTVVAVA